MSRADCAPAAGDGSGGVCCRGTGVRACPDATARYNTARKHLDEAAATVCSAGDELGHLQSQGATLHTTHTDDAHKTADAIRKAADSKAPPEPGWLDKVGDWFGKHGADLLTVAASVAGVAAIFFPPLALAAIALSLAAATAHAVKYGVSGLVPTSMTNLGNDLTLLGDPVGALPGGAVVKGGVSAYRASRAAGAGVKLAAGSGVTEVRTAAEAIDPSNPLFTKVIEGNAAKLKLSPAAAQNVSDGVQATTGLALTAPTAVGLFEDDPGPGLTAGINYTTGAGNAVNAYGVGAGGSGKTRIVAKLLGGAGVLTTGAWGVGSVL
ncbi:hypothetical protein AB0D10_33545 [Kitasatospora sp. NPDC048545]|uniref:hypothetical protein n=1 Tax=Kitasatospora sp. NPDC048545 TaxID=3157208 RepID=UPI0033DB38E9